MKRLYFYLCLLTLPMANGSFGQDFTNEGDDFWFAYPEVRDSTLAEFTVYISSRTAATGLVEIPGTGFSTPYAVVPGTVTEVDLDETLAHINTFGAAVPNRAIHVTSDVPVAVFAGTDHQYRSEATILLPTASLGSNYVVTTFPNFNKTTTTTAGGYWVFSGGVMTYVSGSSSTTNDWYRSEFTVVTAGAPAEVEITPTVDTRAGNLAGVPFTVTLAANDIFMVQADTGAAYDLTGSTVSAVNGTDLFVVMNGHEWAPIQDTAAGCTSQTADPMLEIAYPTESWGTQYIVIKTEGQEKNLWKAVALNDNTQIFENGTLMATLDAGESFENIFTSESMYITGDGPFACLQSPITRDCVVETEGDPSMVLINPNEQMFLDTVTFHSTLHNEIDSLYVNVVTRTSETGLMQLNGTAITGWTAFPYDPFYSYKIISITEMSHTLTTTGCGMLAYSYGLGWAESYFFSAGCRVNNLDDSLSFENQIGETEDFCDSDIINFTSFTTGGTVVSYEWDFGDGFTGSGANPTHAYAADGWYEVQLIVNYLCESDTLTDSLEIFSSPTIAATVTNAVCDIPDGSIDVTITGGSPGYTYAWGTGATTEDLTGIIPGSYDITVTDTKGCFAQDTFLVTGSDPLDIEVSTTDPTCFGFSDGTATVDNVIGGTGVVVYDWSSSSNTTNIEGGLSAGPVTVTVTDANGCSGAETVVIVDPEDLPQASFTYSPDGQIGSDDPYVDFYNTSEGGTIFDWTFGDGGSSSLENPSHDYPAIGGQQYLVTLIVMDDNGCQDEATTTIDIEDALLFYVPNAFTPDGNQYNNEFKPVFTSGFDPFDYHLTIFNRWGEILFESYNAEVGWDGTYKSGGLVKDDVLVWAIEFGDIGTDRRFQHQGHVTILK